MFPGGTASAIKQQAEAAKHYQGVLNELR